MSNNADPVYAAFRSVPDYSAPPPYLKDLHKTLDGAMLSLYPDREDFRNSFRETSQGVWEGPDGFGMVKRMEIQS